MSKILWLAAAALPLAACGESKEPSPAKPEASASASAEDSAQASIAALAAPRSKDAALKLMHDRHENMETIGDSVKAVRQALKSSSPDLAVIRKSADTIAALAPKVPGWFPPGTGPDVGKTEAKAEIWQRPEDFTAKAGEFLAAAKAFQSAAQAGDMAAINERFAAMGKTCKACHDPYREEH